MGIFDNIAGLFSGATARDAANRQIAGLNAGFNQASPLLQQAGNALQTNYTAGIAPFLQNFGTGQAGTAALTDALGITGDPSQVQARFENTPGYKFQLQQGTENALRNASRTGGLNSGQMLIDLQNVGQGQANQTYQQYVNNLMPFLNMSGQAAGGIGSMYAGLGNAQAQNLGTQANLAYGTQAGIGNAQANAELARNQGAQNVLNLGQQVLGTAARAFGMGFAEGGRPPVGEPSVVGEKGPELFVPDQPGTIVPNWMLRGNVTLDGTEAPGGMLLRQFGQKAA